MSKSNESRWQKITLWDLGCFLYWGAIFVSFCILFDWPIDFREVSFLSTPARKTISLAVFWFGTIITIQTVCGLWGSVKTILKFLKSPLSATKIAIGFLWDSRKIFVKYKKQLPIKQIFFVGLFTTVVLSLTETNPDILRYLKPCIWIMLGWVVYECFKWSLNPLPFLEKIRAMDSSVKVQKSAVQKLAMVEITDATKGHDELLKKLDVFKKLIGALPKIINFLKGPRLLFGVFTAVFIFGAVSSLALIASLLRIEHLLTPGGAFAGKFFNGSVSDFFYITINQFFSSESFNVEVLSASVRWPLSILPIAFISLTLLLVLVFQMVGQNEIDSTFKGFGNDVLKVIDEATRQISDKKEVILIDQRKDKSAKPIEVSANTKTDMSRTENIKAPNSQI